LGWGAAYLLVLVVAAGLRLWQIERIPPGFHLDESFEGVEAWRILTEPGYRPVVLPGNFGVLPLNAYANALTFAFFESMGSAAGPTAMRVTAALLGVLGVVAVFGLAVELRRQMPELLSPAFPWLAAASLAGMRWHIHFSRMGIEPVLVPVLWAAALWALLRAWRTGAWWAYALCGALLALSMYAYQGAWVIPFLAAAAALHLLWAKRTEGAATASQLGKLGVAALVAVVGIIPLARVFIEAPELLLMRPAQIAIVGETASPADSSPLTALWATSKMFGPWDGSGDLDPRRNIPGAPALNLWQALPFYLGLGWALWRFTRPGAALVVVGLAGLLLPGVVSEYAPHFHRVLGATAATALLCALGLDLVWRSQRQMGPVLVCVLLSAGTLIGAADYFGRWATLPDLYHAFDVGLWEGGQWVADLPEDEPVYTTPRGAEHPTLAFAWRERRAQPLSFDGRYLFALRADATLRPEHYFVVEHEDFRTRLLLPEVLPGTEVSREFLDPRGEVYARLYTRPAGSPAARPPRTPLAVTLGDGIRLAGFDVLPEPPRAGASLYLQLHWLVDATPSGEWTVFTHVVDSGGARVAGFDSRPGRGSLPTTKWQPGLRILDEYEIPLPAELAPGRYGLRSGLYRADGARLPAVGPGVELGEVQIVHD